MGDPLLYRTPVVVELERATETLQRLLGALPDSTRNTELSGTLPYSPRGLLDTASRDGAVRDVYGVHILVAALTRIVADQDRRIRELEEAQEA